MFMAVKLWSWAMQPFQSLNSRVVTPCGGVILRMQETLKSVIAQYNASQLLTMREVQSLAFITL